MLFNDWCKQMYMSKRDEQTCWNNSLNLLLQGWNVTEHLKNIYSQYFLYLLFVSDICLNQHNATRNKQGKAPTLTHHAWYLTLSFLFTTATPTKQQPPVALSGWGQLGSQSLTKPSPGGHMSKNWYLRHKHSESPSLQFGRVPQEGNPYSNLRTSCSSFSQYQACIKTEKLQKLMFWVIL